MYTVSPVCLKTVQSFQKLFAVKYKGIAEEAVESANKISGICLAVTADVTDRMYCQIKLYTCTCINLHVEANTRTNTCINGILVYIVYICAILHTVEFLI